MMREQRLGFALVTLLLLGVCVPEAAGQIVIHSHPGWLDSTTQEGFDVAAGWPLDQNDCCWGVGQYELIGDYTKGTEPLGQVGGSAFWNPNHFYPSDRSYLWVLNEGATLESLQPVEITADRPWLFIQFYLSDMNDGLAEIAVEEMGGGGWLAVGNYDTFGRGTSWASIEGLPLGSYYVRITSRWNGRMTVPPNGGCDPAVGLQPARIGRTAAVPPESIHLTGGGWLPLVGGKATISMDITFNGGDARPTGFFTYIDHVLKVSVQSTEILGIEVVGVEARLRLAAVSDAGTNHTVYAHMVQGGSGVGKLDINVSRDWTECRSGWVYQQHLTLGRGQIKVH